MAHPVAPAVLCLVLALTMTVPSTALAFPSQPLPPAPRAEPRAFEVKSRHGSRTDEYHWLRDDDAEQKRPEVLAVLEAENAYTEAVMAPLAGLREKLVAEMRGRIREDESTPPGYDRGHWYWTRFDPGAEYPVWLRRRGTPAAPDAAAPEEVLLDGPALAKGHAYFSVGSLAISPDGRRLAWTEDTGGRRIHTLRVKELDTGALVETGVTGVLESLAWAGDNQTVFYVRQDPVTLQSGPIYRHRVGTPPASDRRVFAERDKTMFVSFGVSASREYLLIQSGGHASSATWALPLARPASRPALVFARRANVRHDADHHGGRWLLRTNERAPNFRLVAAPEGASDDRTRWKTLVPGRRDATLEGFAVFERGIAVQERVDADARVRVLATKRRPEIVVALAGGMVGLARNRDADALFLRYEATSLVQPQQTWDLDLDTGERVLRKERAVPNYRAADYATARTWARAADGARVPVTLAWHAKRAARRGKAPILVEGYGAYGTNYDPEFSVSRTVLMDRGVVIAIAHVRGGAELGEAWYEAGRLLHKKNSFTDFIAAVDHLVAEGHGAKDKVFATGGSAGGLLMGAVANLAPERFRGIVMQVPFVDVVTTMLDATIPLTANEWSQWGDPRDARAYRYMLSYSPYDNIAAKAYPPMLVTTGLWDSQVQYYEPAKYVARLRARKTDSNPLLLHTNMQAGHGGSSGRFARLVELAREHAFVLGLAGIRE
jgi:oligopeptidase B